MSVWDSQYHQDGIGTPTPLELLHDPAQYGLQYGKVYTQAPMVRYSKVSFRTLCAEYNTHMTWTPMILAKEFTANARARDSDFSTHPGERGIHRMAQCSVSKSPGPFRGPLLVQFASQDPVELANAAELIRPYVDGIDLNCGCPQSWAYEEGIGSALLKKPDLVRDMIRSVKARLGQQFCTSIKIRYSTDLKETELLVRNAQEAGVDFLTVHGRTRSMPSSHPVQFGPIKFVNELCRASGLPVLANGDVFDLVDATRLATETGTVGVMSARGLQANPALYAGHTRTPDAAIKRFARLGLEQGLTAALYHRHLADMMESRMTKSERKYFNSLSHQSAVVDYLREDDLI